MKMKETFCSYTDFNDDSKKIHKEMEELKNELDKTRNIVRVQRVRYQQLVSLFSAKLQEKEEETRNDLQIKHIQLTRILRALYILEAKLRKEQRSLKSTLMERDVVIKTQQNEITKLKSELERSRTRCPQCVATRSQNDTESKIDNKPDLISSIIANSRNEPNSDELQNDENTYVISSLDDYDASLSTLHVRGANDERTGSVGKEDDQNANNENLRNRMIDEELQNEMRKFKMKDDKSSPRMILKEVTENPNDKLNGPVLKCVKQILSVDQENGKKRVKDTANSKIEPTENADKSRHPVKPPKPCFVESKKFHNAKIFPNALTVKPLPAEINHNRYLDDSESTESEKSDHTYETLGTDESKIVQTVSALLSDSDESEDESETSSTVSQMVKKFEGLKCKKNIKASNGSKNDSMLQTNFEEFHLVDKEIESTCEDIVKDNAIRMEAEGEEIIVSTIETSNDAKYETFLEVTGLSQKSILTPSRILSNHRNVVKPKDVKYRNRVKAAAIGEKCSNGGSVTSPTMKYWTEPYL